MCLPDPFRATSRPTWGAAGMATGTARLGVYV